MPFKLVFKHLGKRPMIVMSMVQAWSETANVFALFGEYSNGELLQINHGGILTCFNPPVVLHNVAPVADFIVSDMYHLQDTMFAACGVAPDAKLRVIRTGFDVQVKRLIPADEYL